MAERQDLMVRGGCARTRLAWIAGIGVVIASGSGAFAAPINDRGFFGPTATLIDFETDGMGQPVLSGDMDPLMQGETLSLPAGEYAPQGVTFGSDIFWVNDGYPLFDAAQILSGMAGQGGSPILSIPSAAISAFDVLFTVPVDAFGFFVAENMATPDRSGVTFEAYDAANMLIDTQVFGGAFVDDTLSNPQGDVNYGFMGISREAAQSPISRVTVTKGAAILDDLVFQPIPAPGAIGVLGIAGLVASRRRRV